MILGRRVLFSLNMRDYQKSLEKARELHEISSPEVRSALEKVFTELVEDEDERIRKDIISFVEQAIDAGYGIISKERKEKWIAWLKKQGKNSMGISEATRQKLEDSLNKALEKETPESWNKFLDEQGEQKSMKTCAEYYNQDNKLKMPELSEFQNKLADILMYREYDGPDETEEDIAKGRLEYELAAIRLSEELLPLAQKEQKPADKAEQKFEIGDKIIDKSFPKNVFTVTEIINEGIAYVDKTGERFTKYYDEDDWDEYELVKQKSTDKIEPFEIGDLITNGILVGKIDEIHKWGYHAYFGDHYADVPDAENWHKWTVQDAKAGDVLSYRDGQWIFIYKGIVTEDTFKYYALLSEKGITVNDAAFSLLASCIIPATKKQRDLLFQKMGEAGYEWDPKKLKLKKNPLEHSFCNSIKDKIWTEEDDRFFEELYKEIEKGYEDASIEQLKDIYSRQLQWLESIKSRLT